MAVSDRGPVRQLANDWSRYPGSRWRGPAHVIALALLVNACQIAPRGPDDRPAYDIPVGSIFYLNRDITVYPRPLEVGIGSVAFQHGRIIRHAFVDQYEDNCLLTLNRRYDGPKLLESDAFVVERVKFGREYVQPGQPPLMLAAADGLVLARGGDGSEGGSGFLSQNSVTFTLSSRDQGSDYRLECRSWDDYTAGQFLTIGGVRAALGKYFAIQVQRTATTGDPRQ